MELLRITRQIQNPTHSLCTAVNVSASGGLRTLDPPHFPPLQNPGGATNENKGSPYSITERTVPELIPVPGSQSAGDVFH